jgi:hypothetical protein
MVDLGHLNEFDLDESGWREFDYHKHHASLHPFVFIIL